MDSGKVRAVGVSNFNVWDWRLLQANMRHQLAVNQVEMSLLKQDAFIDGTLSAMQIDGLTPMAWSPLGGGKIFTDVENKKVTLYFDADDMLKTDDFTFSEENGVTTIVKDVVCKSDSYIMSCLFPYFKGTFSAIDQESLNNFKTYIEKQ